MVTDVEGRTTRETYRLFVRYQKVVPIADDRFQRLLIREGRLATSKYGDNYLYSIDELTAYKSVSERLAVDPSYFLREPFDRERVTTDFHVQDMVAL